MHEGGHDEGCIADVRELCAMHLRERVANADVREQATKHSYK